jgi:hypothetical protein
MPEEIEIDTDKLRETIDAEIEKSGGRPLRIIATQLRARTLDQGPTRRKPSRAPSAPMAERRRIR